MKKIQEYIGYIGPMRALQSARVGDPSLELEMRSTYIVI